jgi:hypothetical protein
MPAEVLRRLAKDATALRCSYCGFVWFNGWDSHAMSNRLIPAGFYDAPMMPQGFVPVPLTHPIRQL